MINNFFTVDYALGILITLAIVFTILIITVIVNKFLTSYKKSKVNVFNISSVRTVRSTLARFLSISLISLLGAGVFSGLFAVSPNMQIEGNELYQSHNVMDIRLLSTFGFNDADLESFKNHPEVDGVMRSFNFDTMALVNDNAYTFRFQSLINANNEDYINQLTLIEGRMPKNNKEIVIIKPVRGLKEVALNSELSIIEDENNLMNGYLENTNFKIVGIAQAPYYLSFLQGNTTIGNGTIEFVGYIPIDNFTFPYYTELFITLKNSSNYNIFKQEYRDYVGSVINDLDSIKDERESLIYESLLDELAKAQQIYNDNLNLYQDGLLEYQDGLIEYNQNKKLLDDALLELTANQRLFDQKKQEAEELLGKDFDEIENKFIFEAEILLTGLKELKKIRDTRDSYPEGSPEYIAIDELYKNILEENKVSEEIVEIFYPQIFDLEEQFADLKLLIVAKHQLDEGWEEYHQNEKLLNDGKNKLDEANILLTEAEIKLNEAFLQLKETEDMLKDQGSPKWYLLDRDYNHAFASYKDYTFRMYDLATIFPVVFFLVAALVSLSTMTRMVNEERTLIGTFKSLGYTNAQISKRYITYALLASVSGSIVGVVLGYWIIPSIIWNAFKIVFALPPLSLRFFGLIAILSIFITGSVIVLATYISVRNNLKEKPAQLMRAKAPKIGKKTLLEKWDRFWSKLNFSKKATFRNLSLHKVRMLMTVVGIVGSTALLITAFGANNAANSVTKVQFNDIFKFDSYISYTTEEPSPELVIKMNNEDYFKNTNKVFYNYLETSTNDFSDKFQAFIISPEKTEEFREFVRLYTPKDKKDFTFKDNSVVITNKLAMNLKVGIGDYIEVKYIDKDGSFTLQVTDITLNYAMNYIYIGKDAYQESFAEAVPYNRYYTLNNNLDSEEVFDYIQGTPGVEIISFKIDEQKDVDSAIDSINTIILVLIVAAGLLSFVVLYNLANINIGEREREIATLKVLGFTDHEINRYIFGEINLITIFSTILGLFVGLFLYKAVIITIEADIIFLTRTLTWQGYLMAGTLSIVFGLLVNQIMKPKLKRIDMLESLKSNE